jgi:hypothetical protein
MAFNLTQRPQFYEEQYLGAADLSAAVDYGRIQQARHALGAHTWGIAIGLQLKETPQPGGAVTVHLLPGYAWDGYGRPIVVLAPYKIPEEKFSAIKFDASIDADGKGRLIEIWLRYDELATQPPRPGFEICDVTDQGARIQETFRVEIGDQPAATDRYSGVTIAAKSLPDAKTSLKVFDPAEPFVYDESIPHQALPEPQDRARWLVPIGYVRWLPVKDKSGHFVARDDSGAGGMEKDSDKIRRVRRYIGVVAEFVQAADNTIRLRKRGDDPDATTRSDDLVWVEGALRVNDDLKMFGGKLDFRNAAGDELKLQIRRQGNQANSPLALQAVIGPEKEDQNRFAIGRLKDDDTLDEKFTVLSSGAVGIGTSQPSAKLEINDGNLLLKAKAEDPGDIIFQNSAGAQKGRIWANPTPGPALFLSSGDNNPDVAIDDAGNVGIGTKTPYAKLTLNGSLGFTNNDSPMIYIFESGTNNPEKAVVAHSSDFSTWGLFYNDSADQMIFKASGSPVMTVDLGDNKVGIGTNAPDHKLHVVGDRIRLEAAGGSKRLDLRADGSAVDLHSETSDLYLRSSGGGGNNRLILNPYAADGNVGIGTTNPTSLLHVAGDLTVDGSGHSNLGWSSPSDERLKKDVVPLTGALEKLSQLRGVQFYWKEPEKMGNLTGSQMGLVAQEVEKVFPEWVAVGPNGYKALNFRGFEALVIEALRELKTEVENLKKRPQKKDVTIEQAPMAEEVRELKTEIESFKDRLHNLETQRTAPRKK